MAQPEDIRCRFRIEPDWKSLPEHTHTLQDVPGNAERLRFRREKNSHRGLREFRDLKELVIFCPNQECIEEIACLANLEFLYIDETRATDLSALRQCRSLRHLTIKAATRVPDLHWLATLPPLESVLLEHFKMVSDLSPLASLSTVRALGIEGSIWTRQKVDSLRPLAALTQLEALFITNCKPAEGGLAPLHALANLRYLATAAFYKDHEFIALQEALPKLACDWFDRIAKHGSVQAAIDAAVNK